MAISPGKIYELWRQDDNGNAFFVKSFSTQVEAQKQQKEYENKGHKQMYWVEERI